MKPGLVAGAAVAAVTVLLSGSQSAAADAKPVPPAPPPALFTAAGKGDAAEVGRLLAAGSPVEESNKDGVTPLMYAAETGRIEVMKLLVAAGADPARTTLHGWTALHHAASACSPEGAKFLLDIKTAVDPQSNPQHQTPLLSALRTRCWSVAELLLGAGADLKATEAGKNALIFAMTPIEEGVFDDVRPPLDPALARALVDRGAALDVKTSGGWTLMHLAARSRDGAMVGFLAQRGMKADSLTDDGRSTLLIATADTNLEKFISGFSMIAAIGPDYQAALGGEDGRMLERRLRTQPNPKLGTRLIDGLQRVSASRRGTIQALLAAGADPNVVDKEGKTALSQAAQAGDGAAVEALLVGGADPNAIQPNRFSPLMLAAHDGSREVVTILLGHGAKPDLVNAKGETALMRAASAGGDSVVVKLLLEAGAAVDLQNSDGQTALIYALGGRQDFILDRYASNPEVGAVVAELLAAGADPTVKDAKGQTPESLAKAPKYRSALKPVQAAVKARRG